MRDRVVVVTGASSGIGRETALSLAKRGATVVLLARRASALEGIAQRCEREGARAAVAIPCDTSAESAVTKAADEAADRFGRIDAWVNNAGVLAAGRFTDTPPEVFRRVFETNFFGYVHGARAALRHFLPAEYGIVVNNASILGLVAAPNLTSYVASKFAINGLTESLRQELRGTGVHVCAVLPATIHSPIWSHAANFTGRQLKPVPPAYKASQVAEAIVDVIRHPRPRVLVGASGWIMRMGRVAPPLVFDLVARRAARLGFGDPTAAPTAGNLFEPMGPGRVNDVAPEETAPRRRAAVRFTS